MPILKLFIVSNFNIFKILVVFRLLLYLETSVAGHSVVGFFHVFHYIYIYII